MLPIHAVTFAPFARRGTLQTQAAFDALDKLKETTGANTIILVPAGWQEHAQSEKIDYLSERSLCAAELTEFVRYAHGIGLRVAMKPTVNCLNGTWRAHINFFEEDVPCEPKWSNWFTSYTEFMTYYAGIAQDTGCELFIAGCEMVQSERREKEWRACIASIRCVYHGPVTYNTDKYQEHRVKWWDCLDMISSSGYYPIGDWENQLDRIEKVVKQFEKPFFFAECGCMSTTGSSLIPNDWSVKGELNVQEQADWYEAMFTACRKRDWVEGFGAWAWNVRVPVPGQAFDPAKDLGYDVDEKPACAVIKNYFADQQH